MTRSPACSLVLIVSSFTALAAQNPVERPAAPAGDKQFVLAPGEHDLRTMIAAAASYLGSNLLLSELELPANTTVALQVGLKLDREGCLAVVTQLGYTQGLVLVPVDRDRGLWEFINLKGPRRGEVATRAPSLSFEAVRALKGVRTVVTTVIPVEHVRAQAMAQSLRPFFASSGSGMPLSVASAGTDAAVVVSGLVDDVLSAAATIAALDLPAKEKEPTPTERLQAMEAKLAELAAKVRALERERAKD